jgi:AcrR family transcriptional regulator
MVFEKRRNREKEIRKSAILKAARKLFFERGFRSVTVESIAKKAELSKGAVYLYFKSKDEIYSQILLNDINIFHGKVIGLIEGGGRASEMLFRLSSVYVDFFLKDRELFRILITFMLHANHSNLPEDFQVHIIKSTNKTIDVIENIITCGIESGEFSPSVSARKIRNALWGFLNGVLSLYIFVGTEARREELIRSTISAGLDVFLKGLKRD